MLIAIIPAKLVVLKKYYKT